MNNPTCRMLKERRLIPIEHCSVSARSPCGCGQVVRGWTTRFPGRVDAAGTANSAGRMRQPGQSVCRARGGAFPGTTETPQILHSWFKEGELLANMPGLRLRLFVCYVQGFRSIGIIRIESQYFAQFHNSI